MNKGSVYTVVYRRVRNKPDWHTEADLRFIGLYNGRATFLPLDVYEHGQHQRGDRIALTLDQIVSIEAAA